MDNEKHMDNGNCEFKGCKEKSTHILSLGSVKTHYCIGHKRLIRRVLVYNDINLLKESEYMIEKRNKIMYKNSNGVVVYGDKYPSGDNQ